MEANRQERLRSILSHSAIRVSARIVEKDLLRRSYVVHVQIFINDRKVYDTNCSYGMDEIGEHRIGSTIL
jgi:hypothetical protein